MRRKSTRIIPLIILTGLLSLLSSILVNYATSYPLPPIVVPILRYAWPLLGLVTIGLIVLAIWMSRLQEEETQLPAGIPSNQNRQRLITKVQAFWIKGILEQSLYDEVLIALGLRELPDAVPDAVAHPWRFVLRRPDQSPLALPPGTRITQVYYDAEEELLILGEPGAGKTTLLLELARDLLNRAAQDSSYPIPVIFNLSSWASKQQPLAVWLAEELHSQYKVPYNLSYAWVANDQIVPLLDGLDEVAQGARRTCVNAINTYREEHGLAQMVVCSRTEEYLTQGAQIQLRRAVVVQPLTPQQVADYVASTHGKLAALQVIIDEDTDLQELTKTPLMLNILALTYDGIPTQSLSTKESLTALRERIFHLYVQYMLQHRGMLSSYKPQQVVYWLSWLARQVARHDQTVFYVKEVAQDWLPDAKAQRRFKRIILLQAIVLGIVGGGITWLAAGLIAGLLIGSLSLLFGYYMMVDDPEREEHRWNIRDPAKRKFIEEEKGRAVAAFTDFLIGAIIFVGGGAFFLGLLGLVFVFVSWFFAGTTPTDGLWNSLQPWLLSGFIGGSIYILLFLLADAEYLDIVNSITKLVLWRDGLIPWNYRHFLNYAAECSFLRKVGSGYIFMHRLLLDYFKDLPAASASSTTEDARS